jgi:hypothetical protein
MHVSRSTFKILAYRFGREAFILPYVNKPGVFAKPVLISPEVVNFIAHEIFVRTRKSPLYTLQVGTGVISDKFI